MIFVFIKDLNNVPVRLGIRQLEYVGASGQNHARDLNGLVKRDYCFLVPLVCSRHRRKCKQEQRETGDKDLTPTHFVSAPFNFSLSV
jgi:hypothetical protein